jgi:hypothetical protein
MSSTEIVTQQNAMVHAGESRRDEFGATSIVATGDMATAAVAKQAEAAVNARFVMAMQRPRDIMSARVKLLNECRRPGFAQVARFRKPAGREFVEGFSIRFAEAALRALGNVLVESPVLYDDAKQRLVSVRVTDLESNTCIVTDVAVAKTVERRVLRRGQAAIRSRVNANGDTVHIVEATDDEIQLKQGALISKAMRNAIMRILPGDIAEECREQIAATLSRDDAQDPAAAAKRLADAFAAIGVMPAELAKFLGCAVENAQPRQIAELRGIFAALKAEETTWAEVMAVVAVDGDKPQAADEPRTIADLKASAKAVSS